MKILLYGLIALLLVIGLYFITLSLASRKQPELGLLNDQLRPCPSTPNCVCSETVVGSASVAPLSYSIALDEAWRSARQALLATGGELVSEQATYLHARYVTPLMRYVDDVELRIDEDAHVIHIRSASRVGHSDLGANRRRVERIRTAFEKISGAD